MWAPRACGDDPNRGVLEQVLTGGARFAVEQGHGVARDLERCEDGGVLAGADAATVSDRAVERGLGQIASLVLAILPASAAADRVYDAAAAAQTGLSEDTIRVMIDTGSRGSATRSAPSRRQMGKSMGRYGIQAPDRESACVPVASPEGQAYLAAMAAAANYGRANRQLVNEAMRRVFEQETATSLDFCMTCAEPGEDRKHPSTVRAHRVRACKARPAHYRDTIPTYRRNWQRSGEPALIPGTMDTASTCWWAAR